MNIENISICPICDNTHFEHFLETTDFTLTHEKFELRKCTNCSFVITTPRPSIDSIGRYYVSDKYISHSGGTSSLFDAIYRYARTVTLKWKFQLINQYLIKGEIVLDYGCGTGEFLRFIQGKGVKVIGIEPNENARKKASLLLKGGISENLDHLTPNSINLITLWHVLEHVHDLNKTILNLRKALTTSGHLIIAVPNLKSYDAVKYNSAWAGYDVPRHLWHFSQETLTKLLQKNGLDVVTINPMKLDSFYVSLLSEGYKFPGRLKLINAIKAFIIGFISNMMARRNSQYSSLIYIAKSQ